MVTDIARLLKQWEASLKQKEQQLQREKILLLHKMEEFERKERRETRETSETRRERHDEPWCERLDTKTEELDSDANIWRQQLQRRKAKLKRLKSTTCVVCDNPSNRYCSQCKVSCYCSTECQRIDWKKRHKDECMLMWSQCPTPYDQHID